MFSISPEYETCSGLYLKQQDRRSDKVSSVILSLKNISKQYPGVLALNNVSLDVYEGEDENVYTDRSDEALSSSITARLQIFPQLVLTSHQAFFTREAMQAIAVTTMENARNFNEGNDLGDAEVKMK